VVSARGSRYRSAAIADYLRWCAHRRPYEIHHVNKNPCDDRPENLLAVTVKEHKRLHEDTPPWWFVCPGCWGLALCKDTSHRYEFCSYACYTRSMRAPGFPGHRGHMPRPERDAWIEESLRRYAAGLPKPLTCRQQLKEG